jgi:hypothetical protein
MFLEKSPPCADTHLELLEYLLAKFNIPCPLLKFSKLFKVVPHNILRRNKEKKGKTTFKSQIIINALSLLLPPLITYFVRVIEHAEDHVVMPRLRTIGFGF